MVNSNLRSSFAVIDTNNLKKNFLNLRKKANNSKVMAVVKADAYGHGLEIVANALESLGDRKPEYYAVALVEEGVELRKLKIRQPILVFDTVTDKTIEKYFKYKLTPNIFSLSHLRILENFIYKNKSQKKFPVHIEVDTGMNRLGVNHNEAYKFISYVSNHNHFYVDGVYTHFATADERKSNLASLQLMRFTKLISELKEAKVKYGLAHAANSGAVLNYPDSYFDMIRPGISLYGYYPSLNTTESVKLYPVLSLITQVGTKKTIQPGETVSYGERFTAKQKTNIVSLPVGYADGINRNLTNNMKAIIKGKVYRQIGTVTMDRIMLDVGSNNVNIGDKVILLGKQKKYQITAWDWSKVLNTIPYEITCAISKRVPRVEKK